MEFSKERRLSIDSLDEQKNLQLNLGGMQTLS